jgi:[acyl-carrier-protein] S-malonyltransferase
MSEKRWAFIFPGQGSQYIGMGKDFFTTYPLAKETLQASEDILKKNISKILLEGPKELLTATSNSQLAIFIMSVAITRVIEEQLPGVIPSICGGLSLGEYSALVASNKISFEECLPVVQARASLMHDACEQYPGTMAVVMGLSADDVESLVAELELPHDLWVANLNCPGQVVLSGTKKGIEKGKEAALKKGAKRVLSLPVHGAFHSGLMQEAAAALAPKILSAPFKASDIELVMNVPGKRVEDLSQVKDYLIDQVTHPVRWQQCINSIESSDASNIYLEIGPGKTLTGMNRKIGVAHQTLNVERVEDLEKLATTLETLKMEK